MPKLDLTKLNPPKPPKKLKITINQSELSKALPPPNRTPAEVYSEQYSRHEAREAAGGFANHGADSICHGCRFGFSYSEDESVNDPDPSLHLYCTGPWLHEAIKVCNVTACRGYINGTFDPWAYTFEKALDINKGCDVEKGEETTNPLKQESFQLEDSNGEQRGEGGLDEEIEKALDELEQESEGDEIEKALNDLDEEDVIGPGQSGSPLSEEDEITKAFPPDPDEMAEKREDAKDGDGDPTAPPTAGGDDEEDEEGEEAEEEEDEEDED